MPKKNPSSAPAENEHIFPASQLTPLAVQWKQYNSAGRHKEAMLVLEQIVEGSTAMFERLAQFEDFHYTVDLPILVSAAQEKVIKWLAKWQPKKGKLFSWFSKSFAADTYVILQDGTAKRIEDIVAAKYAGNVLSWNRSAGRFEPKPIIAWHKTEVLDLSVWRRVRFKCPGNAKNWKDSSWKKVTLTNDHEVYTDRGLVRVDELVESDRLCVSKPVITADGMSALIGMYLGDGSVTANDYFVIAHGTGQESYTRHVAEKFGNRKVWFNRTTLKWRQKATGALLTRKYPVWRTRLLYKRLWPNCPLTRNKQVTEWLLDNLTPVALAYWYMDDGSLATAPNSSRRIPLFCCENFSLETQERIAERLLHEWGLHVSPQKYKGKYRLVVLNESLERFFSLIQPYLLRCFDYKIPAELRNEERKPVDFIRYESDYALEFSVTSIRERACKKAEFDKLRWKYDITVADNHNVVVMENGKTQNGTATGLCSAQCAKNAFRSELVKVNQYRKRYHVTSDSLEKFYGVEDHEIDKHDIVKELNSRLRELTCRWGDPQEVGAIRYLTLCIVDDDHDKQAAIRSASYAYGISFELSKFFYNWSIVNLRHAFYEKVFIPFSEHDLLLAAESYTFWPEFVNIVGIEKAKECAGKLGGQRIKFPTLQYISKLRENHNLARDVERSDLDPDSIAEVARKNKKTARTAQEVFTDMVEQIDPKRYGEYDLFGDDAESE